MVSDPIYLVVAALHDVLRKIGQVDAGAARHGGGWVIRSAAGCRGQSESIVT